MIADLHTHTVLSPCGDLEMSPILMLEKAKELGIDILGITDHNSTLNAVVCKDIGKDLGVFVLMGAEVTSKEEVHCLCFMPDEEKLKILQEYIDNNIGKKKNKPEFFGEQLIVDRDENIIGEEEKLLFQAINQSVSEIANKVNKLGGIFIPAHSNAHRNSIGSQLGFVPDNLYFDAIEIIENSNKDDVFYKLNLPSNTSYITSSDAHYLKDIGKRTTNIDVDELSFAGVKSALKNK
ncbi:MAG: PHP domain-containing protein [Ichthyobacteriaceae bacterium]|nr:PHP domain-containing protein [Ichthyobacteriaceae bacterium]